MNNKMKYCRLHRINTFFASARATFNSGIPMCAYKSSGEIAIENHAVLFECIKEWDKLKIYERLDILQTIADITLHHFENNRPICLRTKKLNINQLGCFSGRTSSIFIDFDLLKNGSVYITLLTLFHETFHVIEMRAIELSNYLSDKQKTLAECYRNEMTNYVSSSTDSALYIRQACEIDACIFASNQARTFFLKMSEMTGDDYYKDYLESVEKTMNGGRNGEYNTV